ncbi:hypothetical protein EniLVp02_0259 [Vibrio phage EniLVp02]
MAGYRALRPQGGGALTIPSAYFFATNIERDDYFSLHPDELKEELQISVAGGLQQYVNGNWIDTSAALVGPAGQDADGLLFQYSEDGHTNWTDNLIPAIHKYWRWSTDGGLTWSADYVKMTGSGDGSLPPPYEYRAGINGSLELYYGDVLIQRLTEEGTWISTGVYTGTGSFHLGELHSNGSSGENVVWVNSDSQYAYYPNWLFVSQDGTQVGDSTCRLHGDLNITEPYGAPAGGSAVDCNTTITTQMDSVFFYTTVVAGEAFTGRVQWNLIKSTGKVISQFYMDIDVVEGQAFDIYFKYPIWIKGGQTHVATLVKDDGTYVKLQVGTADGVTPYRKNYWRSFTDYLSYHRGNIPSLIGDLNSQTGDDRIVAAAIRDFPMATKTNAGFVTLGDTLVLTQDGKLEIAISPASVKVVATKPDRLALPMSNGAMIAIQENDGSTWAIEALQDPSVDTNWKQIGTVATKVVSFNGRIGAVKPLYGDYTQDLVITNNDTTDVAGILGFDSGGVYWESEDSTVKIYQTNKSEFNTLSGEVDQIYSQINTPVTGIIPRLVAVEQFDNRIGQVELDLGNLDDQINDPVTGLVKQTSDIYSEVYTSNTGLKDRVTELEQGGASTMKFRTHSTTGVYEAGEVVQRMGSLWKANSAIDGSIAPVPFVIGTTGQTWSAASVHNPSEELKLESANGSSSTVVTVGGIATEDNTTDNVIYLFTNPTRKRMSIVTSGTGSVAPLASSDLVMLGDLSGAISTVVGDNLPVSNMVVTDGFGKLAGSSLDYSQTSLIPQTHDAFELGSQEKSFKSGYFQFLNFQSASGVNEGNIDADPNSLGIFGVTELALGFGNNNKDLTFTATGLTLSKDLTVLNGNNIKFQDGDSENKEGVNLRMNGNNLGFYGVEQGVEGSTPAIEVTYDGRVSIPKSNQFAAGAVQTSSTSYQTICSAGKLTVETTNTSSRISISGGTTHYFTWSYVEGELVDSGYGNASSAFTLNRPTGNNTTKTFNIGVRGESNGVIVVTMRRESDTTLTVSASMMLA